MSDEDYTFTKLSTVDEAWIQYTLRNMGVEIKCDNLNDFPTSVFGLKKISYNTTTHIKHTVI
jgi:hypothetical protein